MKTIKALILAAALLSLAGSAKAWGCTDSKASRVDVGSTKPAGETAGDGDNQYYIGTDAPNPHDYYVCEVPKPTPPPTTPPTPPTPTTNQQTQSQTQSQTSNSTSASNATSNSNSNSTSNSNATASGGSSKSSSTSQGGNATGGNATGGTVSGSGNSTVSNTLANKLTNSGNSHNTNTLSASTGPSTATSVAAGGNQTQSASASNNGNGNGVGANNSTYNSNSETNVAATKIPVESAFAYAAQPTVNCALTYGAGGQGAAFGLSISGSKIDKNCADLEAARKAPNRLTYCKVYIRNDYVRKAGVTLEDCMLEPPAVAVVATVPVVTPQPMPTIIVNIPAPVQPVPVQPVPTEIITTTSEQRFPLGSCSIINGLGNGCKRFIDDGVLRLRNKPDAKLRFFAPPIDGGNVVAYLRGKIDPSRVLEAFSDEQNNSLTLELVWTVNNPSAVFSE